MTTLGAMIVFFFKKNISTTLNQYFLGLASGVMIAASIWSLIIPSIEESNLIRFNYLYIALSILMGAFFIYAIENKFSNKKFGNSKLFLAVTIHNIPEGLAVGLAFGLAFSTNSSALLMSAATLAFGIGIQNFPEGAAISLPLKTEFKSNKKAFFYGFLSGAVEPIFAFLGIILSDYITFLLPFLLAFAAGTMIYVVVDELMNEINKTKIFTFSFLLGFLIMMILDVAL